MEKEEGEGELNIKQGESDSEMNNSAEESLAGYKDAMIEFD